METFQSGGKSIRLDVREPDVREPDVREPALREPAIRQPPATGAHPRFPAILLLHGAGGNSGFWFDRIAPFVTRLGLAVYAVHYFDRTGTLRADLPTITDGVHVPLWLSTVRDALAHISQRPAVDPTRISLIGISLGAYLSLALATLPYRPAIRALVEISGGLASPYASSATSAFPPTLLLHGTRDTVVPVSEAHALAATLTRLHVPHTLELLPDEGHWFSPPAQLRILTTITTFLIHHLNPRP